MTVRRISRRADRPDYSAALRQTVTLYHVWKSDGATRYHRTVFEQSAYLEGARRYPVGPSGLTVDSTGLCVLPVNEGYVPPSAFDALTDKTGRWTVGKLDKVLPGTGPEVSTAQQWGELRDACYPDCFSVQTLERHKTLEGALVHIEVRP